MKNNRLFLLSLSLSIPVFLSAILSLCACLFFSVCLSLSFFNSSVLSCQRWKLARPSHVSGAGRLRAACAPGLAADLRLRPLRPVGPQQVRKRGAQARLQFIIQLDFSLILPKQEESSGLSLLMYSTLASAGRRERKKIQAFSLFLSLAHAVLSSALHFCVFGLTADSALVCLQCVP